LTIKTNNVFPLVIKMPVRRHIPLNPEMDLVLRRLESGPRGSLRPEFMTLVKELLAFVEDHHLLKPAMAYRYLPLEDFFPDGSRLKEIEKLGGSLVSMVLPAARDLALVVATIGAALEEKVSEYSGRKALLEAMILDSIGSAALDTLTLGASNIISSNVASRGFKASSPLTPGMPGIPLSDQKNLFDLVPAEKIGVRLNASEFMIPQKSVSMIIGLGPDMPTWTLAEVCAHCSLKNTCRHRVLLKRINDGERERK